MEQLEAQQQKKLKMWLYFKI